MSYTYSKLNPDEMRELYKQYTEMIKDYREYNEIWKIISVTRYSEVTEHEMDELYFTEEEAYQAVDYFYEQQTEHYTTYRVVRFSAGNHYIEEREIKPPKQSNAVSVNAIVQYINLLQDFIESVDLFRDNEKLAPKYGKLKAQAGFLKRNMQAKPETVGPNKTEIVNLGKIGE